MYIVLITADEIRTKSIIEKNLNITAPVLFCTFAVEDKPLSFATNGAIDDTQKRTYKLVDSVIDDIKTTNDNVYVVIDIRDSGLCAYLATALNVKIHTQNPKLWIARFTERHSIDILLVINEDEVVSLD
jgi:hypothetical protein